MPICSFPDCNSNSPPKCENHRCLRHCYLTGKSCDILTHVNYGKEQLRQGVLPPAVAESSNDESSVSSEGSYPENLKCQACHELASKGCTHNRCPTHCAEAQLIRGSCDLTAHSIQLPPSRARSPSPAPRSVARVPEPRGGFLSVTNPEAALCEKSFIHLARGPQWQGGQMIINLRNLAKEANLNQQAKDEVRTLFTVMAIMADEAKDISIRSALELTRPITQRLFTLLKVEPEDRREMSQAFAITQGPEGMTDALRAFEGLRTRRTAARTSAAVTRRGRGGQRVQRPQWRSPQPPLPKE